jgi:hypothetical protein
MHTGSWIMHTGSWKIINTRLVCAHISRIHIYTLCIERIYPLDKRLHTAVNETASLSSVHAPQLHVKLRLPSRTILDGHLTALQCESILFAVWLPYPTHVSNSFVLR